jgi:hypothetical protein
MPNLWGVTWWCSHDLNPKWHGFDPLEYDLGLFNCKNEIKPAGKRMAELIKQYKTSPPKPMTRPMALVVRDELFTQSHEPPGWHVANPYMKLISEGVRPSIVLESRVADNLYLEVRGIDEIIRIS